MKKEFDWEFLENHFIPCMLLTMLVGLFFYFMYVISALL